MRSRWRPSRISTNRPGSSVASPHTKAPITTRRDSPAGPCAAGATRSSPCSHGWPRRSTRGAWPSSRSILQPSKATSWRGCSSGAPKALGELGRHREAIEAAERALDLVGRDEQTDTVGFALLALGRARSNLGEVAVARTLIERALVVFGTTGSRVGTARAYHRLAEAQRFDDFAGELQSYRRAFALYGRDRPERELVAVDLAYLLTVAGGREARDWLARATRLVARSGDERGVASLRRAAAYTAWYRGDLDGALGSRTRGSPFGG